MIVKKIAVALLTGAAVVSAMFLVATSFADRLDPAVHPILATLGMAFPFAAAVNVGFVVLLVFFKWKRLWIPLLAFALCYEPLRTFLPLHPVASEPPGEAIKLMSYNVCAYGGNYIYDQPLDVFEEYLQKEAPDILCTQEDHTVKHDATPMMTRLYAYNDTVHVSSKGNFINALGIHTRYPILKKERIYYQSKANGSVAWFLKVGSDTLIVINNHLESTHLTDGDRKSYEDMIRGGMDRREAEKESKMLIGKLGGAMATRASQARKVSDFVRRHRSKHIVVCGDFNDTPLSYARRTMARGLTDCFAETGNGLGLSYNRKGFNFRIDYILCSPEIQPFRCTVDSKMNASDHYPIYCWLKIAQKP